MKTGISYIAYDIPKIYLDIEDFSKERKISSEKLKKGLGIYKMSILDHHQDTATLAGNALYKLVTQHKIDPTSINRIYLGTESALDGSKPTSTYAVDMVETQIGKRVFKHTDVVDMTFACIGAVDVLQNALDYVRVNPDHKAIVIASDFAKYDLNSPGEYTQGAGSVAFLVESDPKIIEIGSQFGVGFKGEHDFFKPRRFYKVDEHTSKYTTDHTLQVYREEPVFDGQFSNKCYQDRIREAYFHFKKLKNKSTILYKDWSGLIFHLPYAYHGKRIFTEIYKLEEDNVKAEKLCSNIYNSETLKLIAKSDRYQNFVKNKISLAQKASSQIGNIYSASIFMSLISELWYKKDFLKPKDRLGFIAYGSGSKSKVFEGSLVNGFQSYITNLDLDNILQKRKSINFKTYEKLHKKNTLTSVIKPDSEFALAKINSNDKNLQGRRHYTYLS